MDMKKLAPWNWFKKENENMGKTVPVKRGDGLQEDRQTGNPLHALHREVDRLFADMFQGFGMPSGFGRKDLWTPLEDSLLKPHLDLSAEEDAYTVSVEIPGVDEKDVRIDIANDTLTIQGEKKQRKEEKDKHYYRLERSYGHFQRILSLPEDADQDNVSARFKNGILQVKIPRKSLPAPEVRQIEIQSQ
jgi:HSP20 family protein